MIYSSKCWNCSRSISKLEILCESCGAIQPPSNWNPFDIFGLKHSVEIKKEILDKKLLELQIKVHPDKFFNSSDLEKKYSMEVSSEVNQAYDILVNNVERINYLLKSAKFKFDNEKQSFNDKTILNEIMDIQNKCLMCETDKDKENIKKEICEVIDFTLSKIKESYSSEDFQSVHRLNVKLSYLEKLTENLKTI